MTIHRIQRQRTRGWRIPPGTLCVSRPSIWGNPWIGRDAVWAYQRFCEQVVSGCLCLADVDRLLDVELTFRKPIDEWGTLRKMMFELKRHPPVNVACWCPLNQPCHADLIRAIPSLIAWDFAIYPSSVGRKCPPT